LKYELQVLENNIFQDRQHGYGNNSDEESLQKEVDFKVSIHAEESQTYVPIDRPPQKKNRFLNQARYI